MSPDQIKQRVLERLGDADAQVSIRDLTGTADHWQVTIVSKAFEGKPMLAQHRLVKSFFEGEIASNELHALSLKTYTPEEWSRKQ